MNKKTLFPDVFLEHSQALIGAQDQRAIACALRNGVSVCADHVTIFRYIFLRDKQGNPIPHQVEVVDTWDRTGKEILPLAGRYLWEDFPLHAVALSTEVSWLSTDSEQNCLGLDERHIQQAPAEASDLLAHILEIQDAALLPLSVQAHSEGFVLVGWRGEGPPFDDFLPFLKSLTSQAANEFRHRHELDVMRERMHSALQTASYERIFHDLVENTSDAVAIIEPDMIPFYVNPAFAALYGFDSVHKAMMDADLLMITAPEDRERLEAEILPQAQEGTWQGQLKQLRQGGVTFEVAMTAFSIYDQDGELAGVAVIVRDETTRLQLEQSLREQAELRAQIVDAQRQLIEELSTPVIPVTDKIMVMPLVGSVDTKRALDIMRALLRGIREHHAQVVILDITGVPIVDSGVVGHLNKTIQAARLKGARVIITGISNNVAETIVDLGIDWSKIATLSDLQAGISQALRLTGQQITDV